MADENIPEQVVPQSLPLGGTDEVPPDFSKLKTQQPPPPPPEPSEQQRKEQEERDKVQPSAEELQARQDEKDRKEKELEEKSRKAEEPVKKEEVEVKEVKKEEPEKPKKEKKEKAVKLLTDEEIEDLHPDENISDKGLANFKEMRNVIKTATSEARSLQTKVEQLEKQVSEGKVPEATQKRLDELEKMALSMDVENDPRVAEKYGKKMKDVQDRLVTELRRKGLGDELDEESRKNLFEKELWDKPDSWWKKEVIARLTPDNPEDDTTELERAREVIKRCLLDRDSINVDRREEVEKLKGDLGNYSKEREEFNQKRFEEYRDKIRDTVISHTTHEEWACLKDVPPNATAEMKAKIEKHNKAVTDIGLHLRDLITKISQGDPETIGTVAFEHAKLQQMVKKEKDTEQEIKSLTKRLEDAENLIAGARKSGRIAQVSRAPEKTPPKKLRPNEPDLGGTNKEIPPDFNILGRR